ncbi:MAG: deoxyhypusine synthase [Candidatus Aenigmatarchaeota archaeon]|nr:MAG: deoxyhypusine synthase [Candidatus Aenigmarchaeota archaeon]RLJ08873.1 MAG: deoxyhypusine synthase [Candidatus Aenigmarchaeota archaeon]RLJ09367.1 MAG: deoxyhypusine synthase [Candidatus Aenigmarchaeota archaeon]
MSRIKLPRVEDISINANTTIKELVKEYEKSGGFTAKKTGTAVKILEDMFSEKNCIKLISFPAAIISTGARGLIKEVVKRKMFDLVITTCGFLDHDFARVWKDYYHGDFNADDAELHKKGINRLGNIFVPNESYGEIIEEKLQPMLKDIYDSGKKELSTYEFVWEIGKRIEDEKSVIYWAYKNKIPVVIPGITDGAFGTQILMFIQRHKDFKIDVFKDEEFLSETLFADVTSGALIIGGGISKHHTIWWNQFKGGLNYAVYITTAPEWDGSLSGARMREAVSWGKVKEKSKYITVEGDATVLLPLILGPFL